MTSSIRSQSELRPGQRRAPAYLLRLITGLIARLELLLGSAGVREDQGLSDILGASIIKL